AYLVSVQVSQNRKLGGAPGAPPVLPLPKVEGPPKGKEAEPPGPDALPLVPIGLERGIPAVTPVITAPQVINLIRVPGSQQVLLKVRVAELNRTAMRQIGVDFLATDPTSGRVIGSQIGGAAVTGTATATSGVLKGVVQTAVSGSTTLFGVF